MPKFYVECQQWAGVFDAETREIAAVKACVKHSDKPRPDIISVNEQGFKLHVDGIVINTSDLIESKTLFTE